MARTTKLLLAAAAVLTAASAGATIFGGVRGIIHDPQHRPVAGAQVTIHAAASDWAQQTASSDAGEFEFSMVPVGEYVITLAAPGFAAQRQTISVRSGDTAILHFALKIAQVTQNVDVTVTPAEVSAESSTTESTISRRQIAETAGTSRANSLAMITDYVPGAYVIHNELHLRGGHGFEWLLDGVPVPNTNISSNVGPQFDPKDIDYLEVQRGGLSAEYGDRSSGVFNVVTRSGFERNRQGELVASFGSFNSTDDQLSFGDHTERFAYYASLSGNRSDLGLQTPTADVLHDMASGGSAFVSLIFNKTPADQLRLVSSLRGDHYQVPNTPEQQQSLIRDVDNEQDALANFSWIHTFSTRAMLTVSPFFHFNRAHYLGGSNDPIIPEDDRGSTYAGGVVSFAVNRGKHNMRAGVQGIAQHDNKLFALTSEEGSLRTRTRIWGEIETAFVEDQYKPTQWLTFNGGLRFTRFGGALGEHAFDPRAGASLRLPRLHWVLRGSYSRLYQPPPLLSVGGPVLDLAATQGFGFLPLRGERDEQHEFGLTIPVSGWTAEITNFRTGARNFFDHEVLGNSNIFFPVTIERARIRGWEASLRSPRLLGGSTVQFVYSRQVVQGRGGATGGLTDFAPPDTSGYYFLDHDQRHTFSAVGHVPLPWRSHASAVVAYGSGFLDGDGPRHLPAHTTVDLSLGKAIGENLSLQVSALNVANRRFLLDNSNSFGGTHFVNPRQIALEVRYRFHY